LEKWKIQGSPEWLDFRTRKIGASDAPVILGISPWKKREKLLIEKKLKIVKTFSNAHMERGKVLEPEAIKWLEKHFGVLIYSDVLVSKKKPWCMASFDGISLDGDHLFEVKCPTQKTHETYKKMKKIPAHYYAQIQHQIFVLEVSKGYFCSYHPEEEKVVLEVHRDNAYIENLLEKEEIFYKEMQEPLESGENLFTFF
jgi:putative phage-type endonuclease